MEFKLHADFELEGNDSWEDAEESDMKKTSEEDVSEEVKEVEVAVVTTGGSQSSGQTGSRPRLPEGWSAHVSSSFPGQVMYIDLI